MQAIGDDLSMQDLVLVVTIIKFLCCSHIIVRSLSRVVDEVTDVLGDREVVTWEDVEKLEYTLQVWGLYEPLHAFSVFPRGWK